LLQLPVLLFLKKHLAGIRFGSDNEVMESTDFSMVPSERPLPQGDLDAAEALGMLCGLGRKINRYWFT
jgi:hypothetical protein